MFAPGYVTDLGERGQRGWDAYFQELLAGSPESGAGYVEQASNANGGVAPSVLLDGDANLLPGLVSVDWSGYPVRIKQAVDQPDAKLDKFIDWTRSGQTYGRAICHEEYLEWRSVRQADGKLLRLEFTTETPDYWAKLARYEPQKVVELAARFAGEPVDRVDIKELFGVSDPFSIDPFSPDGDRLEAAYRRQNYASQAKPPRGAYNNGVKAILHMANGVNSTAAAVALAVFAAYPHGKHAAGHDTPLSGPEAIEATPQQAVNCRNSDPTIVGVVLSTVFARSKVALMDPFGIYIISSPEAGLSLADGSPVPSSWFSMQRGTQATANPQKRDLFQRLVIQAPPGSGSTLNDLRDADGNPVQTGAQVARLMNVGIFAKRTLSGAVTAPANIIPAPDLAPCDGSSPDSALFTRAWEAYSNTHSVAPNTLLRTGG